MLAFNKNATLIAKLQRCRKAEKIESFNEKNTNTHKKYNKQQREQVIFNSFLLQIIKFLFKKQGRKGDLA